jgi:hypothetical protein
LLRPEPHRQPPSFLALKEHMMLNKRMWLLLSAVTATCLMLAGQVVSQETAPRRGGGAGGPGGNPAENRQRAAGRMREALGVSEEQWKVMGPKIERIESLRRDAGEAMMPGRMGPRRDGQQPASAPAGEKLSDAQQKAEALRELLSKTDASDTQVKDAVKALRDARKQARKELGTARKDLLKSVDQKQEARLVLWGVLE